MENRKRGRKEKSEYSKDRLLEELRKLQLSGKREKLTYLGLEKLTGVPRRNWKKVSEYIDNINQGINIGVTKFKFDFALPSIEEVFDLYYGKNREKLMNIFSEYNLYLNQMWEYYSSYDDVVEEFRVKLNDKENEIFKYKNTIKDLELQVDYYKCIYEEQCLKSSNRIKRNEENIKDNVVHINKGDKSKLSLDFKKEFERFLK
ncbi:MAG: hypothetical protein E6248_12700 [Clostridium sp.]|uniref:hypothetical protein n=1 Tax=Clostridium sp. TaxID=1506 RepID=UPI002914F685|nr:hypothetical protein [Clostridium sp.]MDU5111297.1 hypothetical protein [Clostridium sp.]